MCSNYDNGFKAAQRAYDNMLPPEPEEYLIECEHCNQGIDDNGDVCSKCAGEGELVVSKTAWEKYRQKKGILDEDPDDADYYKDP